MQSIRTQRTLAILMVMAMIATAVSVFQTDDVSAGLWDITGKVVDEDTGFPLSGVTVTIAGTDMTRTTDFEGEFNPPFYVERDNYTLEFEIEGYDNGTTYPVVWEDFDNATIKAEAGTIALTPLAKVSGTILILGTELPISGVDVIIDDGVETVTALSGIDGKFSQYVENGLVDLVYKIDGYYYNEDIGVLVENGNDRDLGDIYLEMIVPTPTVDVYGYVTDDTTGNAIDGAMVSISAGEDKWISARTDSVGYYSMMAYPGSFQVKAEMTDYETSISLDDDMLIISQDATAAWRDIAMTQIPSEDYSITGTVDEVGGADLNGATVKLLRTDGKYEKTNVTWGNGDFYFDYNGEFKVVVEMDGFFTYVMATPIDNGDDATIIPAIELVEIVNNLTFTGFVGDEETQETISGAQITLYDKANLYTLSDISEENGYYNFDIHYDASFVMIVDADGYQSEIFDLTNIIDNTAKPIWLTASPKDTVTTDFTFVDWETINVVEKTIMVVDNTSQRVNIDRDYGMGNLGLINNDWTISAAETDEWVNYLTAKGQDNEDTADFLILDGMYYELDTTAYVVTVEGIEGSVITMTDTINITKTYNYTLNGDIADEPAHTLTLNASYDTPTTDMVYNIYLPDGFEMISSQTETVFVTIEGYNDPITIDTEEIGDATETVTMDIGTSESGTAVVSVMSGLYYELNSSAEGYEVIVSAPQDDVDTEITFSAIGSTDPVGDITAANFTWDFINNANYSYGITTDFNYSAAGNYDLTLDIIETGGDATSIDFKVLVDGLAPVPAITVNTSVDNVSLSGTTLTVNEDIPITFDGLGSYDSVAATTDKLGVIDSWFWVWGDDSVNDTITQNEENFINKTYNDPGQYTLEMSAIDIVGHESAPKVFTVIVKDTTAPIIMNIEMFDAAMGETIDALQGELVYLSANDTTDNLEDFEDITFTWDLNDDGVADLNGSWVSHTFIDVGDYNVTLTATDKTGNTMDFVKVVNVRIGDSANLLLQAATFAFDPEEGTVGKTTTISVNITNNGVLNATGISVKFYIRNADGDDAEMSGTVTLKINGVSVTTIGPGETATASISWKPTKKGTYTVWANASTPSEHESQWTDNNNIGFWEYSTYTVAEAGWIVPAIIGGIVVAIIAVFFGTKYFMNSKSMSEPKSGDKKKRK